MAFKTGSERNWNKDFDAITNQLKEYFDKNKVNEFLTTHVKLSQLFTTKIQAYIDITPKHDVKEIKIDIDPSTINMLNNLNAKLDALNPELKKLQRDNKVM